MVAPKKRSWDPEVKRIDGKLFREAGVGSKKAMDAQADAFRMGGHLARVMKNPYTKYNRNPWRVFVYWR